MMVNWYAVGLAVAFIYILPKRLIARKIMNYYKYGALMVPPKTVIVILDDIGMNYEKARTHAKKGARIIIGGQNRDKMLTAKKELSRSTKNRDIVTIPVNRHDRTSMKTFAEYVMKSEVAIDAMINNRGSELTDLDIIFKTQELAKERFENHCLNFLHHLPEDL
ncbi:hypothetical protein MTP99_016187 [Tenebrio molitor]|jgi:short-subunit dehydrogenase involved in D-alanine esterification of teichoic acids|uniref:retinol dehydrogenase 12-like n=1 Tax=Tenebrio molitor TaxID=7067 RepID=UPI0027011B08|nr:hypothetical protein MTP99_016187 [Tenebrio molitor]